MNIIKTKKTNSISVIMFIFLLKKWHYEPSLKYHRYDQTIIITQNNMNYGESTKTNKN